jgi:hypothetical protein
MAMKKEEGHRAVEFGTPDRVDWHLENWRRWMRSGQEVDGHAPVERHVGRRYVERVRRDG